MNEPVKPSEFIVGADLGKVKTDGDSKQKWYVRIFVNRNQQIGLAVMFILTIFTVWYFRTHEMSGVLPDWNTSRFENAIMTQPTKLWLDHEWSTSTFRSASQALHFKTDPIDATLEVQNAKTGQSVLIDDPTDGIPSDWTELKWRLPASESRLSAGLTLTPLP